MEVKIKQGNEMLAATIEMVDGVMVVSPKKVKFEPKDGDIVYVKTNHENIIIYKEQPNKLGRYVNYIDEEDLYIHVADFCGSYADIIEIRLATEEEKQKLFDKIAKGGYEWDADKKEFVKLKWKPKEGDYYWSPESFMTLFEPVKYLSKISEARYKKGLCFKTEEECQEFCNRLNQAIEGVKP